MKIERAPSVALYPVPTVLVTVGSGEQANIITISWIGTVNQEPPMISIAMRRARHSYPLLYQTREFVVNVPRAAQLETVDLAGIESGAHVDKFETYGLSPASASHVAPPLIAECPVNMECVVRHQLGLPSHDLFIGEVLAVHYDEDVLDEKGKIDIAKLDPVGFADMEYWSLKEQIGKHSFMAPVARQRRQAGKESTRDG